MDRIADSGSVGWGFESLRGHDYKCKAFIMSALFIWADEEKIKNCSQAKRLKISKTFLMLEIAKSLGCGDAADQTFKHLIEKHLKGK